MCPWPVGANGRGPPGGDRVPAINVDLVIEHAAAHAAGVRDWIGFRGQGQAEFAKCNGLHSGECEAGPRAAQLPAMRSLYTQVQRMKLNVDTLAPVPWSEFVAALEQLSP